MGWLKNVFKSLGDAGGIVTEAEATEADLKRFLKESGEDSSSKRISTLEESLKVEKKPMTNLKKNSSKQIDTIREATVKKENKGEELERE